MKHSAVEVTVTIGVYHEDGADLDLIRRQVGNDLDDALRGEEPFRVRDGALVESRVADGPYVPKEKQDSSLQRRSVPSEVEDATLRRTAVPKKIDPARVEEMKDDPSRVVARYVKQEKVRPSGRICYVDEEHYDLTAVIEQLDKEELRELRDDDPTTDRLVHRYTDHEGPHRVEVVDQIQMYWKEKWGERLWE